MFRKTFILLLLLVILLCLAFFYNTQNTLKTQEDTPVTFDIATFDSGFGGFFTAKAIEKSSHNILKNHNAKITVGHFGDTKNAPYGEKTPEKILQLTTNGVINAFNQGAEMVFIACNTASTQYNAVQQEVAKTYPNRQDDIISIIDVSVQEVKNQLDKRLSNSNSVHFAILATPATIKSQVYLKALTKIYAGTLDAEPLKAVPQERWFKTAGQTIDNFTGTAEIRLKNGKKIYIYQLAPANWVDLIEKEGTIAEKNKIVKRDLDLLEKILPKNTTLDGVGEFCTHYPVFDNLIQAHLQEIHRAKTNSVFIKQAPLMAKIFEQKMFEKLKNHKREKPLSDNSARLKTLQENARASITLSGDNLDATKRLARTIFPTDAEPVITHTTDDAQSPTLKAQ